MPHSTAPLHTAALGNGHLRTPDLIIIAVYLIAITLFGLRFRKSGRGKQDRSLKSYFLASNTIPWWAIALSVVSAETSTLTIISIPGLAFAGDFGFLQLVIGYLLGRVVVALLFLPRYFAGEMLTAYQLIGRRFGPLLHKVTAALFLLTRAAAEGVRVFAVSIVVAIAIGTGDVLSIAVISLLTLLYTFEGGMAAVIWTDVVQMAIYIGGTLVALFTLGHHVPGGWTAIAHTASAAGKLHIFHFAFNLTENYTFWAGVLGGTFLTMASHGTDQLMVQRLLSARNLRQSQAALLSSGVVIFVQFAFFLLIGAGLWYFYNPSLNPGPWSLASAPSPDRLFPTYIVRHMPIGIAGLLIAAILAAAMSNLSAALNSLSSTTVVDFYVRLRPQADDRERTLISKTSTALWAIVLFAIAVYSIKAGGKGHVVEIGLSIAAVAYGCLLGVFLLGTLTRFATEYGAIIGMICGFALNVWLWQGNFPVHLGAVTIPHIAFTWYVLIGAAVTFAIGALASLLVGQRTARHAKAAPVTALLLLFLLSFPEGIGCSQARAQTPAPGFTLVSQLITTAIAQHQLPGAVVLIGHNHHTVFEHAYGDRKLAGEPGLDGQPSPAEPMTEDTLFDMASLTKVIVTTTAIGELYDQGKLDFDTPLEHYLPAFNPTHDPERSKVTLRLLLTHFSGEPPDVDLKDPWGLAAPDQAEGIRRALTAPLANPPGAKFVYSDINFILLGALVEKLSGEPLDIYAHQRIFLPIGMSSSGYHSLDHICPHSYIRVGAATMPDENHAELDLIGADIPKLCAGSLWNIETDFTTAPTAHDDEGTPATNPDYNHLLRGTVDDPTTRRMGGVAGHAGLFSNAHDMSLFAQALLDKLLHNTGPFPVSQSTLRLMTTPEQPGHNPNQVAEANAANNAAIAAGERPATGDPNLLDPNFPAIKGQVLHGFGWDIDSGYSKPRGRFPIGSFGHTGFTGTSLWFDPASDTYIILLANAIHPHVGHPISNLRGEVATAAEQALGLYPSLTSARASTQDASSRPEAEGRSRETPVLAPAPADGATDPGAPSSPAASSSAKVGAPAQLPSAQTQTGLDVLESTHFAVLTQLAKTHNHQLRLGLLTNQTGIDSHNRRTVDILYTDLPHTVPQARLTTLFSPEHGIFGQQDTEHLNAETDPTTGLHVTSLYGPHDRDKRPSHDQLKDLDAVVIDLQDAGVRWYTYETVLGYFLEAAAHERTDFHHDLAIVVLDRPNPIGGEAVQGPVSDPGLTSYIDYMPLPARHGLTFGELTRYIVATKHLDADLTVVPMQNWHRSEYFNQTGLPWVNPSPNLRTPAAEITYPAVAFVELTNISCGRGTSAPFELFGAGVPARAAAPSAAEASAPPRAALESGQWFHAAAVAAALNARHIPGVHFTATTASVADNADRYPFHGQTIQAVRLDVTNPPIFNSPETGVEILAILHRLYPTEFQLERALRLVASKATMEALARGDDPRSIAASWRSALDSFRQQRAPALLY